MTKFTFVHCGEFDVNPHAVAFVSENDTEVIITLTSTLQLHLPKHIGDIVVRDRVAVVERIAGQEQRRDPLLELGDLVLEARLLSARLGRQFGVVNGNELVHLHELVCGLVQLGGHVDHRHQSPVLPAKLREFLRIAVRAGIRQRPFDFLGAGEGRR